MGVMGGHFVDRYEQDKWFFWRLVPFILIWAAFAIVLTVGTCFLFQCSIRGWFSILTLVSLRIDLAIHHPLRPRPSKAAAL